MRFEEAYEGWTERRLSQEEAASLLGGLFLHLPASCVPIRGGGLRGADCRIIQVSLVHP